MNRRRRQADNFADSVYSFLCTTSSEVDSDTLCSISQDSLDEIKTSNHMSYHPTCISRHSTILAGSCTRDSLIQNASVSPVTSVQSVPDLNKRIELFQNEKSKKEVEYDIGFMDTCNKIDGNKENNNPQGVIEDEQLENETPKKAVSDLMIISSKRNILQPHKKLNQNMINEESKRDSNYNIHNNKFDAVPVLEQNILIAASQSTSSLDYTSKDIHTSDTDSAEEQLTSERKKFETILCSLDNQLNRIREVSHPQQILKRLSDKYMHCPKDFTEKLLTIIEESVMNNGDDTCNASAIDLSRLTTEFRKMCKFIEDESCPEWPPSLLCTPPQLEEVLTNPTCNKTGQIQVCKNEKLTAPTSALSSPATPLSGIDVIKRRFFQKISKNDSNRTVDNVINLSSNVSSTESFECFEAACKRLFPNEEECSQPLKRSLSVPSLLSMTQIEAICEQQMASLSVSNTSDTNKTILNTPNAFDTCLHQTLLMNKSELSCGKSQLELHHKPNNFEYDNVSYSKKKSIKINRKSDSNMVNTDKVAIDYTTFDPNELEKTLLQDVAEKRKRCIDTARLITKINADTNMIEEQKSLRMSRIFANYNEPSSLTYDETMFLKTLLSCKDYQTYLEQQKPLFNLLETSISSTPKTIFKNNKETDVKYEEVKNSNKELNLKKTLSTRKNTLNTNVKSCDTYKSPLSKKRDKENKEKTENLKPKYFFTPGKSSPNKTHKKKKVYFPTMHSPVKDMVDKNILKSPHAKGLYRLNYNTVISPVGMYIRGTDMQLIKNVHAKPDGSLLTPVKMDKNASPSRNSKQITPKSITKTQEKVPLKINLSPKLGTNQGCKQKIITSVTPEIDSTPKSHFVLPKVSYKLPLQVKTIKETKSPKPGTRIKKLLESAQSKVVIRHQGRVNSIQKQEGAGIAANNEVLEINYEPEDESIHIEQAASKTNFIRQQRKI